MLGTISLHSSFRGDDLDVERVNQRQIYQNSNIITTSVSVFKGPVKASRHFLNSGAIKHL